jgi:hypothetical protein
VMLKSPFVSMEAEMDRLFKQIGWLFKWPVFHFLYGLNPECPFNAQLKLSWSLASGFISRRYLLTSRIHADMFRLVLPTLSKHCRNTASLRED